MFTLGHAASGHAELGVCQPVVGEEGELVDDVVVELGGPFPGQSELIQDTFCTASVGSFVVFEIDRSVIDPAYGNGSGGGVTGVATWRTVDRFLYEWELLVPEPPQAQTLASSGAVLAFVIGELSGPCGISPAIGIALDVTVEGLRRHYLIPIAKADPVVVQFLIEHGEMLGGLDPEYSMRHPCDPFGTPCYDNYLQRCSAAYAGFVSCMSWSAVPAGIQAALCFAGCLITAPTGPLYFVCVAACQANFTAGTLSSGYYACQAQLEQEIVNAKTSYCICRLYQQQHCPGLVEPDAVGCP